MGKPVPPEVLAALAEMESALEEVQRQRALAAAGLAAIAVAEAEIERQRVRANAAGERITAALDRLDG